MEMRRVVVTGLGLVTPLGVGIEHNWRRLLNGDSGVIAIDDFAVADLPCHVAARVPRGPLSAGSFDINEWVPVKEQKKMGLFVAYALAAATQALADADWAPADDEQRERTGVMIGSGIGGLEEIADAALALQQHGPRRLSPFFIPSSLINLAAGWVSIRFGLKGPCHAVVTACATGSHAIGDAARLIAWNDADVMVAGSTEAAIGRLSLAGFCAARTLATVFNDDPPRASRPWDRDRDGFVMGEGAGVVILEEYDHARRRGARIYAEVLGYGLSGDAYHITAPSEDGNGAERAIRAALNHAGLAPRDIDYINAHATSTPAGDPVELMAVRRVFGAHTPHGVSMSSTKSAIGHLLGAAGGVEAIFSILALRDQVAPPTLNLDHPCEGAEGMDLVPRQAKPRPIRHVLSNSFGFGGTNAALVFGRSG
jgi:3-oxoacyl-[acyl-carrier-protein] synthase II